MPIQILIEDKHYELRPISSGRYELVIPISIRVESDAVLSKLKDHEGYTPRELEVLALYGFGHKTRVIAERLCISVKTVESHLKTMMAKSGAITYRNLVYMAFKEGLLKVGPIGPELPEEET